MSSLVESLALMETLLHTLGCETATTMIRAAATRGDAAFKRCVELCKLLPHVKDHESFYSLLAPFVARIKAMEPGSIVVVPAGWTGGLIMLVLLCDTPDTFSLAVINAGNGLQHHPSRSHPATGDPQYNSPLVLHDIPAARAQDSAVWFLILKAAFFPEERHSAHLLYHQILPFFNRRPVLSNFGGTDLLGQSAVRREASDSDGPDVAQPTWIHPDAPHQPPKDGELAGAHWVSPAQGGDPHGYHLTLRAAATSLWMVHHSARQSLVGDPCEAPSHALEQRPEFTLSSFQLLLQAQLCALTIPNMRVVAERGVALPPSTTELLRRACHRLTVTSPELLQGGTSLPLAELGRLQKVEKEARLQVDRIAALPSDQRTHSTPLPPPPATEKLVGSFVHPLFDWLLPDGSVDDDVLGDTHEPPMVLPVEISLVPDSVSCVDEACVALQRLVEVCTLLNSQRSHMASTYTLRVALITNFFLHVLPQPLPVTSSAPSAVGAAACRCFWSAPGAIPTAAVQASLLRWLGLASQHHATICFSLPHSPALDTVRLLVAGVMLAITDAVIRAIVQDAPSALSLHLSGAAEGPSGSFSVEMRHYEAECNRAELTSPRFAAARTAVLDYFRSIACDAPAEHVIFRFERTMELGVGDRALLGQLCVHWGLPRDDASLRNYLSGEDPALLDLHPGLATLRDVALLAKGLTHPSADALPEVRPWAYADARLLWRVKEDKFIVRAFGGSLQCVAWLECAVDDEEGYRTLEPIIDEPGGAPAKQPTLLQRLLGRAPRPRLPPSPAHPSTLSGTPVSTEEDVLHVRHLPEMGGLLRPGDSEVLLQCLLVPYIRVPLLVKFFAEPSRTTALASPDLQRVLDAAIFEPSTYHPIGAERTLPELIPALNRAHLATPSGTLVQELSHAPAPLLCAVLSILENALDLDVGRYVQGGQSTSVMLYAIKLAARIVWYARFVLSPEGQRTRGLELLARKPELVQAIRTGIAALRSKLEDHALPVLQGWYAKLRAADLPDEACSCAAQIAFLVGVYTSEEELDERVIFYLLSTRVFINMHYGDLDAPVEASNESDRSRARPSLADAQKGRIGSQPLGFNTFELAAIWQRHLGGVLRWLREHPSRASELLEAIAQLEPTPSTLRNFPKRDWTSMAGCHCDGRYILAREAQDNEAAGALANGGQQEHGSARDVGRLGSMGSPWSCSNISHQRDNPSLPVALSRPSMSSTRAAVSDASMPSTRSSRRTDGIVEYEAWLRGRVCSLEETEINVQLGQLTWKRHQMQLLDRAICEHPDFIAVFGEDAVFCRHQCAEVKHSEHRRWLRMLGARHDLHIWSADGRDAPFTNQSRQHVSLEQAEWVNQVLGEFRELLPALQEIEGLGVVQQTDSYALLTGCTNENCRKEVLLLRWPTSTLHVFGMVSHGRRWQRSLEYTSDTARSLGHLPHGITLLLSHPRPHWHAGQVASCTPPSTSLVITRSVSSPSGLLTQRFVPSSHLQGILPFALLLQYNFWQHRDGSISAQRREGDVQFPIDSSDELSVNIFPHGGAAVKRIPLDRLGTPQPHRARWLISSLLMPHTGALAGLLSLLERVEDHAHILLWSQSGPDSEEDGSEDAENADDDGEGSAEEAADDDMDDDHEQRHSATVAGAAKKAGWKEEMDIELIELPRLRLSFSVVRDASGKAALRSIEHSGLHLGWIECERLATLLCGLPHALLLLNDAGDISVLLSALCKPCRLARADEPLYSQLILARHAPGWSQHLTMSRHYLYDVHRSRSYLKPPSLAASLYLLVLRWLARDFASAFALAPSCVTDAALTPEEASLWSLLADFAQDTEPAAHATRLKLYLGARVCPELTCPWRPGRELVQYLAKLDFIPHACRLSASEELVLLTDLANSSELLDYPSASRRASLLRNAMAADAATVATTAEHAEHILPVHQPPTDHSASQSLEARLSQALESSRSRTSVAMPLDLHADGNDLLEPNTLAGWQRRLANVAYTRPSGATGLGAMKVLDDWMTNTALGSDGKSFAVLYDMLTGALSVRIMIDDSPQILGSLLLRIAAMRIPSELLLILRVLESDRSLAARMPRFKGASTGLKLFQKKAKGMADELHAALVELLPQIPPSALHPPPSYKPVETSDITPLSELRRLYRVWLPPCRLPCDLHARPVPNLIDSTVRTRLEPPKDGESAMFPRPRCRAPCMHPHTAC